MVKSTANLFKLNDSAFAVVGDDGLTNFGIVRGTDGSALLIDSDVRRMDEINDALSRTGCSKVRYLLNTHENFDHSSANHYFAKQGALVIGSDGCQEALIEDGDAKFAEMAGRSPELKTLFPELKMGKLQVTFSQALTLHLPGVDVRVLFSAHNGMSHSRGDSIAVLEGSRILFAGDLLYTDYHPVTVYGDIPNWIASIDHLLTQSFEYVVPGHGPVSRGADSYKQAFETFRSYLSDFHDRLLEMKDGKKHAVDVETYMKSGAYAKMGKTWMVKRNIEYFIKAGK
jgi:glyoxylase-like metal-dependent hydrolase (beta-lactamase superfamily II)